MLRHINGHADWNGELIGDVRYPRNIEQVWSVDELAAIGLEIKPKPQPAGPTSVHVKIEAGRRIEAQYPLWKQANVIREGGANLIAMTAFIDDIRAKSDQLEAMSPTPADFAADERWS